MEINNERARSRFANLSRRTMLMLGLAAILVLGAVSGTIAWLTDTTSPLVNTFTSSDIDIDLTETSTTHQFQMVPGATITKDPKITVTKGSEKCWLFVKVEKTSNFENFMTYSIRTGSGEWTKLTSVSDEVYYRVVEENATTDQDFYILANNQVTVKNDVTKSMMNGLSTQNYPKLTFTAYALQYESFSTAAAAWTQLNTTTP